MDCLNVKVIPKTFSSEIAYHRTVRTCMSLDRKMITSLRCSFQSHPNARNFFLRVKQLVFCASKGRGHVLALKSAVVQDSQKSSFYKNYAHAKKKVLGLTFPVVRFVHVCYNI